MKLTELKNKIDEALRQHDDYDVRITTDDNFDEAKVVDGEIDSGRFYFNIHIDVSSVLCIGYHIEDDMGMEYCSICNCYYSADKECPGCELKKLRENLGLLISGKLF